ncbi:MAG: ATP-dependent RNA helicase [Spirochaetales bacterium]|nr:ATP-dependent RNA helicase [Spirochaetales bacterium]
MDSANANPIELLPDYPVKNRFPEFEPLLRSSRLLALEAPTGSGKTTLLPLLMHYTGLTDKKILVTQPRRMAAKSTAARMSRLLGSPLGGVVGYRVRGEAKVSAKTKIEVVTEGYALALLQADPFLSDYGWVILDEFHERHIDGDLLLAFLRDLRRTLEDEAPGIVAMTATWQGQPRESLEEFPSFSMEGRLFPVEKRLLPGRVPEDLYSRLEDGLRESLLETDGKILIFLPGRRELEEGRRVVRRMVPEAEISLLFGGMELSEQQRVLEYSGSRRQIILATAVAETSLTVEGVGAVVDSGLERLPVYLPGPGLTRLVTRQVSRATAEQRAGRAGRLGPGICYRLWTAGEDRGMVERRDPEIISGELSRARLQMIGTVISTLNDRNCHFDFMK